MKRHWKPKHVGEVMSTIKSANEYLLDIFHLIKNSRYNGQDGKLRGKYRVKQPHEIQLNMIFGYFCSFPLFFSRIIYKIFFKRNLLKPTVYMMHKVLH
jgi:hypothetical protein